MFFILKDILLLIYIIVSQIIILENYVDLHGKNGLAKKRQLRSCLFNIGIYI